MMNALSLAATEVHYALVAAGPQAPNDRLFMAGSRGSQFFPKAAGG